MVEVFFWYIEAVSFDVMSALCIDCEKPVYGRKHAVTCDACERWQHRLCDTGISLANYRAAVSGKRDILFLCRDCSQSDPIAESTLVQEETAPPLQRGVQEETTPPLQRSVQEETAPPLQRSVQEETAPPLHRSVQEETAPPLQRSVQEETAPPLQRSVQEEMHPLLQRSDDHMVLGNTYVLPREDTIDSFNTAEIQEQPVAEPVRYRIVENGSQRGRKLLVDSNSYSYGVKTSKTNDSVNWRCSVRTVKIKCLATVKQHGDHFKAGYAKHIHPADQRRKLKAEVTTKINMMETSLKSKSFSDDSDDMVSLSPRETEDTDVCQDVHLPKVYPKPASVGECADDGQLETLNAKVVSFEELGIVPRPDVPYNSVSLPTDTQTKKLPRKPKDELQRESVTYGTDKDQQEPLKCHAWSPSRKVQQKNEQRLCFKSVQATDHALKLKAKQQDVAKEKQVSTEEMFMQKSVPETAITILQADTGPVKKRKKLHDKITPYTKPPPALAVPMTPVQELNKLHQTKEQKIQYSIRGEHHGGRVVQSGVENHSVVRQPDIPQTVTILDVSNQQPLSEDLQREMQPVFPTPALFDGEDIVDDSGDWLF